MTRVRPGGMEIASPSTRTIPPAVPQSRRASIPAPGEINRQVRRRKSGMLALYWSAGIVAMLTAGGILTAMIARGDADALIQRQSAPPAPVIIASPAQQPGAVAPAVAEATPEAKPAAVAPAPTAKKEKVATAIPGTKPGQIVDLQLWKNRAPGASSNPTNGPTAAPSPSPGTTAGAPANSGKNAVHTPDNDPAVRLARDQLESTFK